jgi:hypothetical protein
MRHNGNILIESVQRPYLFYQASTSTLIYQGKSFFSYSLLLVFHQYLTIRFWCQLCPLIDLIQAIVPSLVLVSTCSWSCPGLVPVSSWSRPSLVLVSSQSCSGLILPEVEKIFFFLSTRSYEEKIVCRNA